MELQDARKKVNKKGRKKELEMWGRAQREATRRCASDWGHNLWKGRVKIPLVATISAVERGREIVVDNVVFLLPMSWSLPEIRDQSLKLSEVDSNFAEFLGGKGPQNFKT